MHVHPSPYIFFNAQVLYHNILLLQQGTRFIYGSLITQSSHSSLQAEIICVRGQGENFPTQKGNDVALLSDQPK